MSDHPSFEEDLARGLATVIKEFVETRLAPLRGELVALKAKNAELQGQIAVLQKSGVHFKGTFQDGGTYQIGDAVQSSGNLWRCCEPTTAKPGTDADAWRLLVRRGRDGKDLTNGHAARSS